MSRCHKRAADGQTEWHRSAATLPADWDDALPDGHFLRKHNLVVHEAADLPGVSPVYALLRSAGAIVAQAAFQVLRVQPGHVQRESLLPWQYRAWRIFTSAFHPKLLVGGQLFRHDVASLHWQEGMTPFDAFEWYRETLEEAARKAGAQAILVKESPPALVPHFLHGAPEYLLLRNDISMQLPIPPEWQNMQDYEKSLKHKYAQRFRKLRQAWAGLRVEALSTDAVSALSADIHRLYLQVTEHQPVRLGLLSEAFIPALKKAYGERLKVWAVWEEDTMIAFASGWDSGGSFDMFYIGFDYARNAALSLYFNILFFAIEQAILLRRPLLILGRTALEAKARVGCRPEYLATFLYIRNSLLRRIIARMQARLGEGGSEWEQRHPFKNKD